jgi:hypothetical protein
MEVQIKDGREHYLNQKYNHRARWLSYWYQIDLVRDTGANDILEVGLGSGVVRDYLGKCGLSVRTLDIDPALCPDFLGSVDAIPAEKGLFDCVLAAEILEHLPFKKFSACLKEIWRVSKKYVVISLPDARRTLLDLRVKLPFLPAINIFLKIPSFKKHKFDGQHYWEIGKTGHSLQTVKQYIMESGWSIAREFTPQDVPTKRFYLLEKK